MSYPWTDNRCSASFTWSPGARPKLLQAFFCRLGFENGLGLTSVTAVPLVSQPFDLFDLLERYKQRRVLQEGGQNKLLDQFYLLYLYKFCHASTNCACIWVSKKLYIRYICRQDERLYSPLEMIMLWWHQNSVFAVSSRGSPSIDEIQSLLNSFPIFEVGYIVLINDARTSYIARDIAKTTLIWNARMHVHFLSSYQNSKEVFKEWWSFTLVKQQSMRMKNRKDGCEQRVVPSCDELLLVAARDDPRIWLWLSRSESTRLTFLHFLLEIFLCFPETGLAGNQDLHERNMCLRKIEMRSWFPLTIVPIYQCNTGKAHSTGPPCLPEIWQRHTHCRSRKEWAAEEVKWGWLK